VTGGVAGVVSAARPDSLADVILIDCLSFIAIERRIDQERADDLFILSAWREAIASSSAMAASDEPSLGARSPVRRHRRCNRGTAFAVDA
jgi:hypothetical protein